MNIENNKIIAEFMGKKELITEKQFLNYEHETFNPTIIEYLKYDTDWNWLMEVVEKIKKVSDEDDFLDKLNTLNSRISIELENQLESCFRKSYLSIEQVYNACIEFIKWYNEQKNQSIQDSIDVDDWSK